jgi:hypothetical protein
MNSGMAAMNMGTAAMNMGAAAMNMGAAAMDTCTSSVGVSCAAQQCQFVVVARLLLPPGLQ